MEKAANIRVKKNYNNKKPLYGLPSKDRQCNPLACDASDVPFPLDSLS
jgi:hypothetical protein